MLTIYTTSWCGYCHRLKSQLDREGIGYDVIDIEADPDAAEFVMSVNGGNQTVPTLRFRDGSALTNPTIVQVKEHLTTIVAPPKIGTTSHDMAHETPSGAATSDKLSRSWTAFGWLRRRRTPTKP